MGNYLLWSMSQTDSDSYTHVSGVKSTKFADVRLKTFKNWPKYLKPSPHALASAGFVYTGLGDRVLCPECDLILHNWRCSDIPLGEHYRHKVRACQFLLQSYCPEPVLFNRGMEVCDTS